MHIDQQHLISLQIPPWAADHSTLKRLDLRDNGIDACELRDQYKEENRVAQV